MADTEMVAGSMFGARWPGGRDPRDIAETRGSEARSATSERFVYEPCGTYAAYRRHLRWGDEPCEACMEAMRVYHGLRPRQVAV